MDFEYSVVIWHSPFHGMSWQFLRPMFTSHPIYYIPLNRRLLTVALSGCAHVGGVIDEPGVAMGTTLDIRCFGVLQQVCTLRQPTGPYHPPESSRTPGYYQLLQLMRQPHALFHFFYVSSSIFGFGNLFQYTCDIYRINYAIGLLADFCT